MYQKLNESKKNLKIWQHKVQEFGCEKKFSDGHIITTLHSKYNSYFIFAINLFCCQLTTYLVERFAFKCEILC